jgi:hypothetical protein
MKKSALIKIAGILVGTFVVITIAIFFLYPYLNEQKYEQVQAEREQRSLPGEFQQSGSNNLQPGDSSIEENAGTDSLGSDSTIVADRENLMAQIASLIAVNDSLKQQLDSANVSLVNLENTLKQTGVDDQMLAEISEGDDVEFIAASQEPKEEFGERVKSLLNLDEEDLTPIANQMTQQELVKIYNNSGNIQREKLLRSLSPERATELMQEIML